MNRENRFWTILACRVFILALLIGIIASFLYFPKIIRKFSSDKFLNVYSFTAIIPKTVLEEFRNKSGIPVRITYFQSNEELLAKFNISSGEGYDVIIVSDYMIEILKNQKLLQKIDKSLISNFTHLDPRLKKQYFDPTNDFSLPLVWTPYGFGVNKDFFPEELLDNPSWKLVFQNPHNLSEEYKEKGINIQPFRVVMPDDPREAIAYASYYLYKKILPLSSSMLEEIKKLLMNQKNWVECYTNEKIEHMLNLGIVPLVIIPAAYMLRAVSLGKKFDFVLPAEGSLIVIENIAIPSQSRNVSNACKFIDFLLSKDSMRQISEKYFYNPANPEAMLDLPKAVSDFISVFSNEGVFSKFSVLRNDLISLKKIDELWLAIKAS